MNLKRDFYPKLDIGVDRIENLNEIIEYGEVMFKRA